LSKKKELMERELKDAEEVYLKKENIKKKLKELRTDSEKQNNDYKEELRKLRKIIEQDKKNGILDDPIKGLKQLEEQGKDGSQQ
jgi:hypothetical protein